MNSIFRKTLLASAVAAFAAAPVWAGGDAGKTQGQAGSYRQQSGQTQMGTSSQVHAMTPSQLRGTEVVGPGGEEVGSVKAVVRSRQEGNIQAIVAAGGVMGVGDKEVAVPLDSLRYEGGKLHISSTEDQLKAKPEYQKEQYVELEPMDQPLSEFSAFETVPSESRSTWDKSDDTWSRDRGGAMSEWDSDARRDKPYPEGDRILP